MTHLGGDGRPHAVAAVDRRAVRRLQDVLAEVVVAGRPAVTLDERSAPPGGGGQGGGVGVAGGGAAGGGAGRVQLGVEVAVGHAGSGRDDEGLQGVHLRLQHVYLRRATRRLQATAATAAKRYSGYMLQRLQWGWLHRLQLQATAATGYSGYSGDGYSGYNDYSYSGYRL